MGRIARLTIVFATISLPWFERRRLCRAQSSASPPSTARVIQQSTIKTASAIEPRPVRNPTTKLPPPRAWTNAKASGKPVSSIPRRAPGRCPRIGCRRPPAGRVATTVDPAVVRGAQDVPQPLPPGSETAALAADGGRPDEGPLKPAPLEPADVGFPINLATALRLSDARPLIVAAAQASVWVAEAQLTRPRSSGSPLWSSAPTTSDTTAAARISTRASDRAERELFLRRRRLEFEQLRFI